MPDLELLVLLFAFGAGLSMWIVGRRRQRQEAWDRQVERAARITKQVWEEE